MELTSIGVTVAARLAIRLVKQRELYIISEFMFGSGSVAPRKSEHFIRSM